MPGIKTSSRCRVVHTYKTRRSPWLLFALSFIVAKCYSRISRSRLDRLLCRLKHHSLHVSDFAPSESPAVPPGSPSVGSRSVSISPINLITPDKSAEASGRSAVDLVTPMESATGSGRSNRKREKSLAERILASGNRDPVDLVTPTDQAATRKPAPEPDHHADAAFCGGGNRKPVPNPDRHANVTLGGGGNRSVDDLRVEEIVDLLKDKLQRDPDALNRTRMQLKDLFQVIFCCSSPVWLMLSVIGRGTLGSRAVRGKTTPRAGGGEGSNKTEGFLVSGVCAIV